ncbi:MAG: cobalamin-dependent protein [Myxococcales bacterium]|nr:cobalamin-dependent protein [Myxococcales bacterium]
MSSGSRRVQLHHMNMWDDGMRYGLGVPFLISYAKTFPELSESWEFEAVDWEGGGPVSASGLVSSRTPKAEEVAARVLADQPDLVGFTVVAWSEKVFLDAIQIIKEERPEIRVVVGGPMATDCGTELVRDLPVDFLVRGYGELAFVELLRALGAGDPSRALGTAGLYVNRPAGWEGTASDGASAAILDQVPSVFRAGLVDVSRARKVHVEWSRGCPIGCTYCSWGKGNLKLNLAGHDRMVDDIHWAKERGFHELVLNCSAINFTTDKLGRYVDAIVAGDPQQELELTAFLMYETLKPEQVELLRRVRFKSLCMGLQTDEALGREVVGRPPFDRERFEWAVGEIASFSRPGISIISGVPGDTYAKFASRLDYLLDTLDGDITVFPLQCSPGTQMWNDRKKLGIEPDTRRQYWVYETPALSASEHLRCLELAARRLSETRHHVRGFERDSHGISTTSDFFEGLRSRIRADKALVQLHHTNVFDGGVNVGLGAPFLISHAQRSPELARRYAFDQSVWPMHYPGRPDTTASEVLKSILDDPPRIVGFTLQAWTIELFSEVMRELKTRAPDIITVVGGPSATDIGEDLLRDEPAIDFVFLGHAERAFGAWLEALADPTPRLASARFGEIPRLVYRDEAGAVVATTTTPSVLEVLDEVGAPLQDGLVPEVASVDVLNVEWTRGCPVACSFCAWPMGERKLTRFSREYVARDVEWAQQNGFREILICDAAINFSTPHLTHLVETLEEADPARRITWNAFLQYYCLDAEQSALLARLPWRRLMLGLQTDDDPGLAALNRPRFDRAEFEAALDFVRPIQQPIVDVITGVPFDTADKIKHRIEYLLGLGVRITTFPLLALPGTPIAKAKARYGLEIDAKELYAVRSLPGLTARDYQVVIDWMASLRKGGAAIEMVGYEAFGHGRSWNHDARGPALATAPNTAEAALEAWVREVLERFSRVPEQLKRRLGVSGWTPYTELSRVPHSDLVGVRMRFGLGTDSMTIDAFDKRAMTSPIGRGARLAFVTPEDDGPEAVRIVCQMLARLDRAPAAAEVSS